MAVRSLLWRWGVHLQPQTSQGQWRGLAGPPGLETSALSSALPPRPTFHPRLCPLSWGQDLPEARTFLRLGLCTLASTQVAWRGF